jgi:hypothetical protein
MSPRTFARRFRGTVGTRVSLCQHFGRLVSVSPQTYRHVFRRRAATR